MTFDGTASPVPVMHTQDTWNGLDAAFLSTLVTRVPRTRQRTAEPAPSAVGRVELASLDFIRPERDDVPRIGTIASVDAKFRLSLRRVLTSLDWNKDSSLVSEATTNGVIVRERRRTDGALVGPAQLDSAGRLLLAAAVRGNLDVAAGDRVHVVALPSGKTLHLHAERDVLTALTGPVAVPITPAVPARPASNTSTRLRKARY